MTLEVLIDHKPLTFDEPESIAFDLDEDPLLEFEGERHDLPAGAVLAWTGSELHLYPASHQVRLDVLGGAVPRDLQEGGKVLWFDVIAELDRLLFESGRTIKLGLVAQGHVQTIALLIVDGADWPTIGKAIGWTPKAARESWERLCGKLTAYDVARDEAVTSPRPIPTLIPAPAA